MKKSLKRQILMLPFFLILPGLHSQSFTETFTFDCYNTSVAWVDYDNDGDLDAFSSTGTYYTDGLIFRNDGEDVFSLVNTAIAAVSGSIAWGDYDNDGDMDIALAGISQRYGTKISKIYRNDGNGTFVDINARMILIESGTLAWGDYDNDGKIDLLMSGLTEGAEPVAKLYHNEGNDVFTDSQVKITPCVTGMIKWGDFNNDEYLDILMSGLDYDGNVNTEIYQNDGKGNFTSINAGMSGGFRGGVDLGDYDNDGDLDVLLAGQGCGTKIYQNNGNNNFSDINAGLPIGIYFPPAWLDYDNDGDLDVILSGTGVYDGPGYSNYTQLWQNTGNNVFIEDANSLDEYQYGSVALGDYDSDGDADILISAPIKIYRNDSPHINRAPSVPAGFTSRVINNSAILTWDPSTDSETPYRGLTYNVKIGTFPEGGDVMSSGSSLTGFRKLAQVGNAMLDTDYIIKDLPVGIYYWSVQSVDPNFTGSGFSPGASFEILPVTTKIEIQTVAANYSNVTWGDYDNDGNIDFVFTGFYESKGITRIYRNQGNGVFDTINAMLKGVYNATAAWGDYDNDGSLDLFLGGFPGEPINLSTPLSMIYHNDGNNSFTDIRANLSGIAWGSSEWGDFDNDGDLDLLLSGEEKSTIYRNDGNNRFVDINSGFATSFLGKAVWGDFDNDMDLDVLISGQGISLYRNNGNSIFSLKFQLYGSSEVSAVWSDFDNDGDLDILVTGSLFNNDMYSNTAEVYRNDGDGVFTDINAGLRGVSESKCLWGDFNNDGYSDIFYTGRSGDFISKIYLNNRNGTFTNINAPLYAGYRSNISTSDYDNDGDLDFIITRDLHRPILYRNNMNFPNDIPGKPTNLNTQSKAYGIKLSWNKAIDNQSTDGGLYYNIRLGTSPGGFNVISPMVTGGFQNKRLTSTIGNAQLNTSWKIESLPVGNYYWSVQAVDQSYAGGAWSDEDSFEVKTVRTFFSADEVCHGSATQFTDQSVAAAEIVAWKWDFRDGTVSTSQNPAHTYSASGTYNVILVTTDAGGTRDTLKQAIKVKPKPFTGFNAASVCQGIPVTATNTTNINGLTVTSWSWDFGDGNTSSLQQNAPHPYLNAADYTIKLKAVASNGCADSVSHDISVGSYPVAGVTSSGPLTFCKGDSVTLSVPLNSAYTYSWKISGTSLTGASESSYKPKNSGTYTVEIVNPKGNCISTSPAVNVVALDAPAAPLISADRNLVFCQGDSSVLSVTNASGNSYSWKLNGGAVGSDKNTLAARASGEYSLVVSNSSGCIAASVNKITVTVNPKPNLPVISTSGVTTFCLGSSVNLSVPDVTGNLYAWKKENGIISGITTNSFTASASGSYQADISNSYGCAVTTSAVKVTVKPSPLKPAFAQPNYTKGKCPGEEPIRLSAEQSVPGYRYTWYRNGLPQQYDTLSHIEFFESGNYKLAASVGDCTAESEIFTAEFPEGLPKPVIYAQGPTFWYLAASNTEAAKYRWYYNGKAIDGADKYFYLANYKLGNYQVSIANKDGCSTRSDIITIPPGYTAADDAEPFEGIKIYPNPSSGLFTIEMDNNIHGKLSLEIISPDGKKIRRSEIEKTREHLLYQVDLSGQPEGMYIINLVLNKYRTTRKILIE